jgi:hypothetical protein
VDERYVSMVPFGGPRLAAAAVYCSDGRFGEQCDDFLQNGLGLPWYDRVAFPGGAAVLCGGFRTPAEEEGVAAQLAFLIEAHALGRVVLIAHEDCGFYKHHTDIERGMRARQEADLLTAAERVRAMAPRLVVDTYYAALDGQRVAFERVGGAPG